MNIPGPCCICGAIDYPLSCGGPTICPSCDCGNFGITVVQRQAKRIEALEAQAVPPGYIKIPTSRDEAEKMILLAQNYLEFNK